MYMRKSRKSKGNPWEIHGENQGKKWENHGKRCVFGAKIIMLVGELTILGWEDVNCDWVTISGWKIYKFHVANL